jgi:hypothetical protein
MPRVPYRYVATSVGGFVQQLAVAYVARRYHFYSAAFVPDGKDPLAVDAKLLARYRIDVSKWERMRRKREGLANVQYLRFDRFFVLVATEGAHRFFEDEPYRDFRRRPLYFAGYSISCRGGHPHVRLSLGQYALLKAWLLELAPRRSCAAMCRAFASLDVEAYAPVRRQLLNLHRKVNEARNAAGLEPVPMSCLPLRRRVLRPFE